MVPRIGPYLGEQVCSQIRRDYMCAQDKQKLWVWLEDQFKSNLSRHYLLRALL